MGNVKIRDSKGQMIDVSLDEHQLAEKILSCGLYSKKELQNLEKHLQPGHLAIQITYDLLSAGLLTQGSKLPLNDYPHHNSSHIYQSIQDNQAIFKIIKTPNWTDFVKQIENYNYRPALRTQKPNSSQALFKYVHNTNETIPYVAKKRNPHKVYTHTKKQAATYLSKNLHTKVFGEQHPDEPLVGLLFDEKLCMTKAMFRYDRGTYPREWVGSEQAVQSYAKRLQQEKLLFSSCDEFRADIDKDPTLNEALVKFSRESILAIFVASDTPKAKEEARQRQEELFRKFGKRYEIVFYDNKKKTIQIYSAAYQKILDVTGIDILKNPEILSQYQELISGTLHLENQQKLIEKLILLAIFFNNSHALQKLLEYPIDINLKNQYGDTLLIWVSRNGQTEIFHQLLVKGADVNIKDKNGDTALMCAVKNGHTDIVQQSLKNNTDANIKDNALIWAAENGHTEIVEQLLAKGVDINIQKHNGDTALI
jgi:hypothetical protein